MIVSLAVYELYPGGRLREVREEIEDSLPGVPTSRRGDMDLVLEGQVLDVLSIEVRMAQGGRAQVRCERCDGSRGHTDLFLSCLARHGYGSISMLLL